MLQAIGTGCGCADDRFQKTSLCSALLNTNTCQLFIFAAGSPLQIAISGARVNKTGNSAIDSYHHPILELNTSL